MNPKNIFFYEIISTQLESAQVWPLDITLVSAASQPFHFTVCLKYMSELSDVSKGSISD